ncbi:hypothetical protein [Hippea maritima]|uniref:Uncharacterized protein n=1 Tax=Hippea maritima (strain ATCC 700847 / DSM 10411 / MH2) TaxID=760142 RepID=F2LX38_HIPMA|nr:hypothetical protein [Hippea maritima]AEA33096.1 hypothetical protein Hipma_0116 [Hippea maritima DSM 10411]
MRKFLKLSLNTILMAIIILLVVYIVVLNKPSILSVALNFALKKYDITSNFEKIKIKSPTSIEINSLTIKKDDINANIGTLIASIDKNGYITATIKNSDIKIQNKPNETDKAKGFNLIPIKIKSLSMDNISLDYGPVSLKNISASLKGRLLTFKGNIGYKSKNLTLSAAINSANGKINLSPSGIYLENLYINPHTIHIEKGKSSLDIRQPIKLQNIYINLNPFYIKLNALKTSANLKYGRYRFSFKIKANLKNNKFTATINDLRESSKLVDAPYVRLSVILKKNFKLS